MQRIEAGFSPAKLLLGQGTTHYPRNLCICGEFPIL